MKTKSKSLYQVSMVVLYMVCRFGWNLYLKYWEQFAELSDDYTKEYGEQQLAAINEAQALSDASQRRGAVTQQGNQLDASSETGILFWKKLRRYIMKAVPEASRKAAIAQAGGAHFEKARQGNWSEITQLLSAGLSYLQDNADKLSSNAGMPVAFPAAYTVAKEAYDKEHIEYGAAKGDAAGGAVDKIEANNELYKNLQFMLGDAQTVFEKRKSVARQFTFAAVKRLVTKSMGGIHFTIINPATGKPLTEATVTTDESLEAYPVNNRGVAIILMKAGVHSITVSAPGFDVYSGVVKADAGIKHRVKIELAKEAAAASHSLEAAFTGQTMLEQ